MNLLARRRFQPGYFPKCPSRGLLRDCENRLIVCSTSLVSSRAAARVLIRTGQVPRTCSATPPPSSSHTGRGDKTDIWRVKLLCSHRTPTPSPDLLTVLSSGDVTLLSSEYSCSLLTSYTMQTCKPCMFDDIAQCKY